MKKASTWSTWMAIGLCSLGCATVIMSAVFGLSLLYGLLICAASVPFACMADEGSEDDDQEKTAV